MRFALEAIVTACHMDIVENLGNYLMKLASVVRMHMARAKDCDMAAAHLMGTASFITQNMPQKTGTDHPFAVRPQ